GGMSLAQNHRMLQPAGVFADHAELEIDDADIVCCEPAEDGRAAVRLRYRRINAFLGDYLGRFRRGEATLMDAPADARVGDVIDVEVAIDGFDPFVLHGQIAALWAGQARVKFVTGRMTDRIIAPLAERALGKHFAEALLLTT